MNNKCRFLPWFVACAYVVCKCAMLFAGEQSGKPFRETFSEAVGRATSFDDGKRDFSSKLAVAEYVPLADQLVTMKASGELGFLITAAKQADASMTRKLARLTLARLAEHSKAADAICELASRGDDEAVLLIAYMPSAIACQACKRLVENAKEGNIKAAAIDFLAVAGNRDTLELLTALKGREANQYVVESLAGAIPCLEEKVKLPPEQQEEWSRQGISCWAAIREAPRPRLVGMEYELAAKELRKQGVKCSVPFLRNRIKAGDPLAVVLAGEQKEAELVDELVALLSAKKPEQAHAAKVALARIGTKEAVEALLRNVTPEGKAENQSIAWLLADNSGEIALRELERLLADDRFRESHPSLREAVESLRGRLDRAEHP